ncbi:vacuolar aminopeptidase 1 [[Candida] jaroonii]|uniref:Vacuolar aminopeptidase 1 n=1 Tax=[Candida] jaroonii TaxID=467808 RepID=A0ACA9Y6Z2_9ASCO|nr:vacuolar aminopeptidase 1 [[Candida] jaroonii]
MEKYALIDEDGILSWDEMTTDDDRDQSPHRLPHTISQALPPTKDDFYANHCQQYIDFTNDNPTTFHVAEYFHNLLVSEGFEYICETSPITEELARSIDQGGKFFISRGDLTLIAFVIGPQWSEKEGLSLVGAHIDVLTAKLKPSSTRPIIDGYETLGVAPYSGAMSKVWLDRDLGIGGSILVKEGGRVVRKTYKSPGPIAKVPSLAEHFGLGDIDYNPETQMVPIVGYVSETDEPIDEAILKHPLSDDHSPKLLNYIVKTSGIDIDDIVDIELELYDTQPATVGGLNDEFLMAPRLDDRLCGFSAIYGLIEYSKNPKDDDLSMVLLADNEEIGSASRSGAKGQFLTSTVERILHVKKGLKSIVFANSMLLSVDVTHCLNPNFKNVYLDNHFPVPNTGISCKFDPNAHTMTDKVGFNIMKQIAEKYNGKVQRFQIRNDGRSGGTIGPMLATETGSRVLDCGLPILSMHSIRAMCGSKEPGIGIECFQNFFQFWKEIHASYKGL